MFIPHNEPFCLESNKQHIKLLVAGCPKNQSTSAYAYAAQLMGHPALYILSHIDIMTTILNKMHKIGQWFSVQIYDIQRLIVFPVCHVSVVIVFVGSCLNLGFGF